MDIRFRHLQISDGKDCATGFALCYDTIEEANLLFDTLMLGFEKRVGKKINLRFTRASSNFYDMCMCVKGDTFDYEIVLKEIEQQYVKSLKEAVQQYGYIFVITAKSRTIDEFIVNKRKFCCISEFYINNDKITALDNKKIYSSYLIEQYVDS